jgi:hypothetical protein
MKESDDPLEHFTSECGTFVHETTWTAQMTGKHFLKHEHVETENHDLDRVDFTLTDSF